MRNALSRAGRAAILAVAKRRPLLAFDFDGTLAPIVRDPDAATMRPRTAALLAEVATRYPCVVVSGRARADVATKVAGVPLRAVIGNHGMEPWAGLPAARRLAAGWRRRLAAELPPIPGVLVEDKGPSLAIHYRLAEARPAVRRLILEVASGLEGARLLPGKMVVNVLPASSPNKGTAVLALRARLRRDSVLYVGDDANDEDAFALSGHTPLLGIRVGRDRRSRAGLYLPDQGAIDQLLALLGPAP